MTKPAPLRLAITPGEPGGIGPELAVQLMGSHQMQALREQFRAQFAAQDLELVVVADPELMRARADSLGIAIETAPYQECPPAADYRNHLLPMSPVATLVTAEAGRTDPRNAQYVLGTLETAVSGCLEGRFQGMVTGPVNKAVINDGGVPFSGHTEWIAERTGAPMPVMMLATRDLRVALATTHLPLRRVPDAITPELLRQVLHVVHNDLSVRLGLATPRILVCGLNPHAGEEGHMGREEVEVIEPVLAELEAEGLALTGPYPADTVFTPHQLAQADVVVAMYHDQGLPPLKQVGFGRAVNVTLGLPIIRTSVDHGTALDLAGTGTADTGSLMAAIRYAAAMAKGQGDWL